MYCACIRFILVPNFSKIQFYEVASKPPQKVSGILRKLPISLHNKTKMALVSPILKLFTIAKKIITNIVLVDNF